MNSGLIKLSIFCILILGFTGKAWSQLTTSNLPILIITTDDGNDVPDEPKTDAHLGIIWNGDGNNNNLTDPFNHYDGKIGIEKRGSSSLDIFPKVGYAFETRELDGSNQNFPLLGFPEENDWILHGPYSDKSLMRNALAYIMASWIMEYAPRVKFCEMVLNGDYKGVYILTEKIKRDDNRVNISALNPDEITGDNVTGGYILRFDKTDNLFLEGFPSSYPPFPGSGASTFFVYHYPDWETITPAQKDYIQNHMDEVEGALKSPNFKDSLTGYRKYFDVPAFINYLFVQEIARNVDGYRLSTYFYKDKESLGGKIKMGPAWDFNLGFGNVDYCIGPGTSGWAFDFNNFCPNDGWVIHFWWDRMMEDTAFNTEMCHRWKDLRQSNLSDERIDHLVDSLQTLLQAPAQQNFQRWPVLGQYVWPNSFIGNSYSEEMTFLKNWMHARLLWLDANFEVLADTSEPIFEGKTPAVFPNPFQDVSHFIVNAAGVGTVRIELFNSFGQKILELANSEQRKGLRQLDLEEPLAQGMYFYRVWYQSKKLGQGKLLKQ